MVVKSTNKNSTQQLANKVLSVISETNTQDTNNNQVNNQSSVVKTSNVIDIIKDNATVIKNTDTETVINNKTVNSITSDHLLYPGVIGTSAICSLLNHINISVVDQNKLNSNGLQYIKNSKLWHTHTFNNTTYELLYNNNTYFYTIKSNKTINNNEQTTTNIYNNEIKVNNDISTTDTINRLIDQNIYNKAIIVLNMSKNLCLDKNVCYLKFQFYINQLNVLYKTIYVKYNNTEGLLSKQLYKFSFKDEKEKTLLKNGYIKITAYQLKDLSDKNPYIIGKFNISDMKHASNLLTLYKYLEITSNYSFTFDTISIYPTTLTCKRIDFNNILDKLYLSINNTGIIKNTNLLENITYPYSLDYHYIKSNILNKKGISIKIDNNTIWDEYYDYYANIIFYTKNGNNYLVPKILFNKLNGCLILNTQINVDISKFNFNNVNKFSIVYLGGLKQGVIEKLNDTKVKLSKQGNIINK